MTDVAAGDNQVATVVVFAAQHHVCVRVIGVPVIDCHPVEPGPKIGLHPVHQMPSKATQVIEPQRVFGRDDKAELMPILASRGLEFLQVGAIGPSVVGLGRPGIARDGISGNVMEMRLDRPGAGSLEHDEPCLDRHAAGARPKRRTGESCGDMTAPELGARSTAGAGQDGPGPVPRAAQFGQYARQKALAASSSARPRRCGSWSKSFVVVLRHW